MNKKLIISLSIGFIIGLILAFIMYTLTLCPFDGTPARFYCKDWIQIGAPILGFIIPLLISYILFRK